MPENPAARAAAARNLRDAVLDGAPDADPLLRAYARGANGIDPVNDEFVRDLEDIIKLANRGEQMGTRQRIDI